MQNLDQVTWSSLEDEKRGNFNGAKVQRSVCFILLTLSACGIPLPSHLAYPQDVTTSVDNELDNSSKSYKLVWADEFDGTSVDTSKWEFMLGDGSAFGIPGWGNNELQFYTASNATVKRTSRCERSEKRTGAVVRLTTP
ncbi:MAG: hypothetical protein HC765_10685, partial [Brachymonas sp.]|nr:hypothetical protein [Brachymonas sp.]